MVIQIGTRVSNCVPIFLTRGRHLGLTAISGTGSNFDQHYFSFMFPFLPNNIQ